MNPITAINLLCNSILTASMVCFYILLFRSDSVVHRWPLIGHWMLKLGLVLSGSGALFNCLTLSTPPISEVVLNAGQASLFTWAVYFHQNLLRNGSSNKPSQGNNGSHP
jgi:hypothetical protein